jgi:tetratricopeptide (TPR) repeat protein
LERYAQRVARYPNETRYRFELGELHFEGDSYDEALQEFQLAQRNPQLRSQALFYIGRCMQQKGLMDMAVEQVEQALECGPQRMNKQRKEILYTLACMQSDLGNGDKALELFKDIYAADVSYRDVSTRIEEHYRKAKEQQSG